MEDVPLTFVTRMKNANQIKNADTFLLDREIAFPSVMKVSVVDRTHFVPLAITKEFVSVRKALREFLLILQLDVVLKTDVEMTTIVQIMKSVVLVRVGSKFALMVVLKKECVVPIRDVRFPITLSFAHVLKDLLDNLKIVSSDVKKFNLEKFAPDLINVSFLTKVTSLINRNQRKEGVSQTLHVVLERSARLDRVSQDVDEIQIVHSTKHVSIPNASTPAVFNLLVEQMPIVNLLFIVLDVPAFPNTLEIHLTIALLFLKFLRPSVLQMQVVPLARFANTTSAALAAGLIPTALKMKPALIVSVSILAPSLMPVLQMLNVQQFHIDPNVSALPDTLEIPTLTVLPSSLQCASMMQTAEPAPSVKEGSALTLAERMTVVHSQWPASIDVVKILVPSLELVAEMLSVEQRIIVRFVLALQNSRETRESSVKELSSFKLLPVSPIISVSLDSSVKTVLVSRDADTMSIVLLTRLASTDSALILVHSLMHADPTLIVFPTHTVQSVHVNQDLLEMRESTANLSEMSSSVTEIMSVEED